jgi:hypothetical protein
MAALLAEIVTAFPNAKRIGYVRDKNLFGQTFSGSHDIMYPRRGCPARTGLF